MPKFNVQTKKVSGNKSITMVTGFEGFMIDEQYFADIIKKRAQASVSIGTDVSGKMVQGEISEHRLISKNQYNSKSQNI